MQSWGCMEARTGCTAMGRRNAGLPFPMTVYWLPLQVLSLWGHREGTGYLEDLILAWWRRFHSEGGQLSSRVTGGKKLLQLL